MMLRLPFLIGAVALSLAGCVTDDYATGPIKMSEGALAAYVRYKNLPSPEYFAVSVNGNAVGYTFCPDGGSCSGNRIGAALDLCKSYSKGSKCVIYAYGGKPVFDGEEVPQVRITQPQAAPAPTVPAGPPTITTPRTAATQPDHAMRRTPADRLRDLQALRDQGLITPTEYEQKRAAIVGAL